MGQTGSLSRYGCRRLAAEDKDGTVVILRGPWLARSRCRRFGHPRLAKIAGTIYCPRCGTVLPTPVPNAEREGMGTGPSEPRWAMATFVAVMAAAVVILVAIGTRGF